MNGYWDEEAARMLRPRRWPLLLSLVMTASIAVLAFGIPSTIWWVLLYTHLRFDLWWPILAVLPVVPLLAAHLEHRRRGLPQYFPWLSLLAVAAWVAFFGKMLLLTGADEGLSWSIATALGLFVASSFLALTLFAYAEAWRKLSHTSVAKTVSDVANSGTLAEILEEDRFPCWGSPHGLRLLYDCYRRAKREAVVCSPPGPISPMQVEKIVNIGEALFVYLSVPVRWAGEVLSETSRSWLKADVARELMTLCLAVDPDGHAGRVETWQKHLLADPTDYHRFLYRCFGLALTPPPELLEVPQIIAEATRLYRGTAARATVPTGRSRDQHTILLSTWLILARRRLPPDAVFDLWMKLRREAGCTPWLPVPSPADPEPDLLQMLAREALASHYSKWASRTSPDWRSGLSARAQWNGSYGGHVARPQ